MNALIIESGQYTPKIIFQPETNIFSISGRSFPINPIPFYQQVFEWFNCFLLQENAANEVIINFELEYFNTASLKQFAKLFYILESSPLNKKITIQWHYNELDTDILESGHRFNELTTLNFEFNSNKCEIC
jgi:hypothetical protein